MADEKKGLDVNSKEYLKIHGEKKTKIKYKDRKKVEVIKDTKHYKKGDILNPHLTWADYLIEKGIAKEIKK